MQHAGPSRVRGRKLRWPVSLALACVAGLAAASIGGFDYRAVVLLRAVDSSVTIGVMDRLRGELLNHAWETVPDGVAWTVDVDAPARALTATVISGTRAEARASVTELAVGFVERIQRSAEEARARPGANERFLAESREHLGQTANVLTERAARLRPGPESGECLQVDAHLREKIAAQLAIYKRNRGRVRRAEADLAEITAAPVPDRAPADPEARAAAIRADLHLQQDLRALRVQLAELRHHLLAVERVSSPLLRDLAAAVSLLEAVSREAGQQTPAGPASGVKRLGILAGEYRAHLETFSQAWAAEFERLRSLSADPVQDGLLRVQAALEELLSGFTFQASVRLTDMRGQVRGISTGAVAGQHEVVSSLVRAFHTLQTVHHRFEFAAGDAKPSVNFRLDAALKAARGLYHRSRRRLTRLDERLAREALQSLRTERARRIEELEGTIGDLRRALDSATETLVDIQTRAGEHGTVVQAYRESKAQSEIYEERVDWIEAELRKIDGRLGDLAAKRRSVIDRDDLEMTAAIVDRWPVNLQSRLTRGAVAGTAALVTLIVLQMWLAPRPTPPPPGASARPT